MDVLGILEGMVWIRSDGGGAKDANALGFRSRDKSRSQVGLSQVIHNATPKVRGLENKGLFGLGDKYHLVRKRGQ